MNAELLSPAGSLESCKAAINAGADAVYLAGNCFGARAFAKNLTKEELFKAIEYAHVFGRKIYLTVNTLLKNREINNELYDYLKPLVEYGLDAVIVQDFGVVKFIKMNFPGLEIHASTQMTIASYYGAKMAKNAGIKRIVPARELSLEELREIKEKTDIELEAFVHGALCYGYSGQCLFSSIIGGRSGNRGRCAGTCRLPYSVTGDGFSKKNFYPLSEKDICLIEHLPEIIEAGVYSLKIEGRMKKPEYTALVTSIYRKYLDLYYKCGSAGYKVDKKDLKLLKDLYSRNDFTTGYYFNENKDRLKLKDMITMSEACYTSGDEEFLKTVREQFLVNDMHKKVQAKVFISKTEGCKIVVFDDDLSVETILDNALEAQNRPLDKETVLKQMNKTGDSYFEFEDVFVEIDDNAFMTVKALNELRREGLNRFQNKLIGLHKMASDSSEVNENNLRINECDSDESDADDLYNTKENRNDLVENGLHNPCTLSALVSSIDQLNSVLKFDKITRIILDAATFEGSLTKASEMILAKKEKAELYKADGWDLGKENKDLKEKTSKLEKIQKLEYFIALPTIYRRKSKNKLIELLKAANIDKCDGIHYRTIEEIGFIKENFGDIFNIKKFQIDWNVYTFNDYSIAGLIDFINDNIQIDSYYDFANRCTDNKNTSSNDFATNCKAITSGSLFCDEIKSTGSFSFDEIKSTVSFELNKKEILNLNSKENREIIIYSHIPLLVSEGCLANTTKGCVNFGNSLNVNPVNITMLKDRYNNNFKVKSLCNLCLNILYNCKPFSIMEEVSFLKNNGYNSFRFEFIFESEAETYDIINNYFKGENALLDFTRGHYKRGVD